MMRVCIIGNSHAACWLAAWRKDRGQYQAIADIHFFVLGGYDIGQLSVENNLLTINRPDLRQALELTSEGLSMIDPRDYDAFLIVSLTSGYRNLTGLFSQYGLANGAFQPDNLMYLSRPCLEECIEGIIKNSLAVKLRTKLRAITDKPVVLSPSPCQSEEVLLSKEKLFSALCQHGKQSYLYAMYQTVLSRLGEELEFAVLFQDTNTLITGGGYTLRQYNRNGIDSRMKTVGATDTSHMNIDFGRIELNNALRFLNNLL